ncbi:PmoA family protein [Chitinophaga pendula]|uniref:DUF6807 domain-containing protein n=1 Tax=Chitinophaga TaxID=79328 RepID=UPI000BB051EF|nr:MULTISPECIES: PmoA family protein [Chitinophaga]ASZ11771.1 hypothetical protein CK934_12775 [Chitinophaga sp. MD30]UCJ05210.1 PmoA family protein [Chitinophaga pendula]
MKSRFILLLILLFPITGLAQVLARIAVSSGSYARESSLVHCALDLLTFDADTALQLVEVKGGQRVVTPFQVSGDGERQLWWILSGATAAGKTRTYELLRRREARSVDVVMYTIDSAGALVLREGGTSILQYNYRTIYPPAGVDTMYRRSGFIHPLWAPNGAVLTNLHAKGHWHHTGIWNPWTHTQFRGEEIDFWNLQKKEGTVRFAGLLARTDGMIWSGFRVRQEHVVLKGGGEQVALNEQWEVRAYPATDNGQRRIWDLTSLLNCATDSSLTLLQYRYGGGFSFRATAAWTPQTSEVLTSAGKRRSEADSTRANWVKITGNTPQGKAGILVLCSPVNYDAPQPLRIWPENIERGEIMLNYSPTKMRPWILQPGHTYAQRYRIMVYSGDISAAVADAAWNDYAYPPVVKVTKL